MKVANGLLYALAISISLLACGEHNNQAQAATNASVVEEKYVVLDDSYKRLRKDFNAHRGKARLLFIVGDTCGICLRGMADLNDAFIAQAQNDDRLVTLVVHVPTMGAKEKHVADAIPLMEGPRVLHYWDESGVMGVNVGSTLETGGVYAWDVWLAYGPDARWTGEEPPVPEFWMHQLSPFPPELRLDAEEFAAKALAMMNGLQEAPLAPIEAETSELIADGTEIGWVGQPLSVPVRQHIRGTGGYKALKNISRITARGTQRSDGRIVTFTQIENDSEGLQREYVDGESSLPPEIEQALRSGWEANGPLFEWKDRGHQLRMGGMLKVGSSLAWKVFVKKRQGDRRIVYIDSHSGDIVLMDYLNHSGELLFSTRNGDFRAVDGIRMPFTIEYLDPHGIQIAEEIYQTVSIGLQKQADAELN